MDKSRLSQKDKALIAVAPLAILAGIVGVYFTLIEAYKPEILQLKVFTSYSSYLENKYFCFITNNQGDELSIFMYCLGWLLIVWQQKHSLKNKQAIAILIFLFGYTFLHGLAVVYFCLNFLFLLPILILIK